MGIAVENPPRHKGGQIGGQAPQPQPGDEARQMAGMGADIADRSAAAILRRIGAPGGLSIARGLDRRGQPFQRVLRLHRADRPSAPAAMRGRASWTSGSPQSVYVTPTNRPAFWTIRRNSAASSILTVSGFSQITSNPASISARAIGEWVAFGVQIATASTRSAPSRSPAISSAALP